jgi:fructose-1,6-bisphosphatase/inositol monophosphatase family enzyme
VAMERSKDQSDDANSDIICSGPGFTIIVDPIDSTANFASGLPNCAVTMNIVYRDTSIVGIVYDPHRGEFFSRIRSQ